MFRRYNSSTIKWIQITKLKQQSILNSYKSGTINYSDLHENK